MHDKTQFTFKLTIKAYDKKKIHQDACGKKLNNDGADELFMKQFNTIHP